ncbi:N-formimino-L-glutamate deiminase [compost metagenome]
MIAGQGAIARRERRPFHVRQLLGMQLDRQAQALGRAEHLFGFGQRERHALAKHIDGVDQAFGGQRGQHLRADEVDIGLAAARVFGRQRMRAQKGAAHRHAAQRAQAARDAQLLAFVRQFQPVA